ncbi:MAG: hypothetical protein RLO80_05345 [Hyphomonas sp.]
MIELTQILSLARLLLAAFGFISLIAVIYGVAAGLLPALVRLGKGLSGRKVAVFASGPQLSSIRNHLSDSRLFKPKNIYSIESRGELTRAQGCTIFLVHWKDWVDKIDEIIRLKQDHTALVIYAPFADGRIADHDMEKLEKERNVMVTNFRGRLMNDLLVTMIASGYEKK